MCLIMRCKPCALSAMLCVQAAGGDLKIDKQEFVQLFKKLLSRITGHPDVVAEAAAANGYTA